MPTSDIPCFLAPLQVSGKINTFIPLSPAKSPGTLLKRSIQSCRISENSRKILCFGEDPTIFTYEVDVSLQRTEIDPRLSGTSGIRQVVRGAYTRIAKLFSAYGVIGTSSETETNLHHEVLIGDTRHQGSITNLLKDGRRCIEKVAVNHEKSLAVISDNLGRIFVLDLNRCLIVKMFKGLRGYKCGWLKDVESMKCCRQGILAIYQGEKRILKLLNIFENSEESSHTKVLIFQLMHVTQTSSAS